MDMYIDKEGLITVIIPAYNAEKHLHRAVESLINQIYSNLEILIIDDGSKDATGTIADIYAFKDSRIKVVHVENGGEAKARNLGIRVAAGNYIAFCDADDYMHPDMLRKMYYAILQDGSDMAVCSWKNVSEEGTELSWRKPNLNTCVLSSKEAQKYFLQSGNIEGFCWNKLFKKKLYMDAEVLYDKKRLSYCDILANYKLIKASGKVSYIGEQLYDYYQLSTACTHTMNIRKNYDYLETLREVYDEAVQSGLKRSAIIYTVYRLDKQLFEMYKEKQLYDEKAYNDFFIRAYEGFLDVFWAKKVNFAIKYPLESPLKFIVKEWIVMKEYKRLKY